MKTNKKILLIGIYLIITAAISGCVAWGISVLFSAAFWSVFAMLNALQIGWTLYRSHFVEGKALIKASEEYALAAKEYAKKPYKKYLIPLNCAHCGHKNEVEIDLTDTEFRCENCKKFNGIHTNFMTAAITEPVDSPL